MRAIVVTNENPLWTCIFSDINLSDNIQVYPYNDQWSDKLGLLLFKICCNHYAYHLLRNVWFQYILARWRIKDHRDSCILFLNPVLRNVDPSFLDYLRMKHICYGLLFVDTLSCLGDAELKRIQPALSHFLPRRIYSYDKKEAEAHEWVHTYCYYSTEKRVQPDSSPKMDVFLALYDKGRAETAVLIYDCLKEKGIRCSFYISGVSEQFASANIRSGITYNRTLSYEEIIEQVYNCNVLLEICQPGQFSHTLRTYESICYNKKLLTNNQNITAFPFYNAEYVRTFSDIFEIDNIPVQFFTQRDGIDFKYDGRFSPRILIEDLMNQNG